MSATPCLKQLSSGGCGKGIEYRVGYASNVSPVFGASPLGGTI